MNRLLFQYHPVEPTTWVYLSSLLMIGLFFKFGRFWSVRNLDIVLLILLAPGLLLVRNAEQRRIEAAREIPIEAADTASPTEALNTAPQATTSPDIGEAADDSSDSSDLSQVEQPGISNDESPPEESPDLGAASELPLAADEPSDSLPDYAGDERFGYIWLFCAGMLLLVRLLLDATMVRRPLLEPNLSAGGLTFIGGSLVVFLLANVITKPEVNPENGNEVVAATAVENVARNGPGFELLSNLTFRANKTVAVFSQLAIVLGVVLVGYRHFSNSIMGVGAASLYLMLPYTAVMTDQVDHALPAAFLVWAILWYRFPLVAGVFIGLAATIYYPLFLLPLWISFYWQRGSLRFLAGVFATLVLTSIVLVLWSDNVWGDLQRMFGFWPPRMEGLGGIWNDQIGGWDSSYRIPFLALAAALAGGMAIWPAQKNLGTLLSCSAAVMVATQFWHGYGGGVYMAWYLPLLLLTVFRPNLEDRVALTVLGEGWRTRRRRSVPVERAA